MPDSPTLYHAQHEQARKDAIAHALNVLSHADFQEIQALGWHFQRRDYYSPLNDVQWLRDNPDLWNDDRDPLDIEWNIDRQVRVLNEVGKYVEELRGVPNEASPGEYGWVNQFWGSADAIVQYGLVRSRKPRRYIEIGCGWSSMMLAKAAGRNRQEGSPLAVTMIEPDPRREIIARLPEDWTLHETILQRTPISLFDELEAGDVLFYDGSHCSRAGSDVNWFFFRVLPRIKPGVLIHIHDIFLPVDYPRTWIFQRGHTWNEQYVLQAFLMNNPRYTVELAARYLFQHRREAIEAMLKGLQPPWGSSFWMVKK